MKKRINLKKLLSFLLAVMLIFSTLLSLSSCKNISFENKEEEETKKRHEHPKIPAPDYNGHVFTFLTDNSQPKKSFIVAESEASELLSDAITKRNSALSQKYNITVAHQRANDIIAEVENAVNSGVIDFDAILATGSDLTSLAVKGMLYDLNNDDFSLDAQYTGYYFWDQNANEQLAFGNKLYFSNCAFNIHSFGYVMFFNKYLIEEYNLTSPYEMIKDNTWTIDNWATLVKSVNKDMDGDGLITDDDRLGYLYSYSDSKIFSYASGIRATTNDKNGNTVLSLLDDKSKITSIYNKLAALYADTEHTVNIDQVNQDPPIISKKKVDADYLFSHDYYLFTCGDANSVLRYSEMEHEYGIVPIPKFDGDQKDYLTLYPEDGYLFALPSLMPDPDRTVTIIEDMNYYSTFLIKPTWFDVLLTRRYARDDESEMTLRTLYDNRVYDIGLYNDLGGIGSVVLNINDIADCNVVDKYNRYKQQINEEINAFNHKFVN